MRLIDADSLEEALRGTVCADAMCDSFYKITTVIDISPTVDAEPVRHGHLVWKRRRSNSVKQYTGCDAMGEIHTIQVVEQLDAELPYCSECDRDAYADQKWCRYCGAKMRTEGAEKDG